MTQRLLFHAPGKVTEVEAVDEDVAQLEREQAEFSRQLDGGSRGSGGGSLGAAANPKSLPSSKRPGYQLADFGHDDGDAADDEEEEDCPIPR
jgi:hypothetical protein